MKVVGLVRAKNAGMWINLLLEQMSVFCDEILFLGEQSDDNTNELAKQYSPTMITRPPGHELGHAGQDRILLHERARFYCPDWIYAPDADELLEPGAPEKIRDMILRAEYLRNEMVAFPFLYLWNDPYHYRIDGNYKTITVVRLFRYFPKMSPAPRDSHSMAIPLELLQKGNPFRSTIKILHFGYMTLEQRQGKCDFYAHRDPPGSEGYKQGGGKGDYSGLLGLNAVTDEVLNPLVIL